jgi:hypothetical protein
MWWQHHHSQAHFDSCPLLPGVKIMKWFFFNTDSQDIELEYFIFFRLDL